MTDEVIESPEIPSDVLPPEGQSVAAAAIAAARAQALAQVDPPIPTASEEPTPAGKPPFPGVLLNGDKVEKDWRYGTCNVMGEPRRD